MPVLKHVADALPGTGPWRYSSTAWSASPPKPARRCRSGRGWGCADADRSWPESRLIVSPCMATRWRGSHTGCRGTKLRNGSGQAHTMLHCRHDKLWPCMAFGKEVQDAPGHTARPRSWPGADVCEVHRPRACLHAAWGRHFAILFGLDSKPLPATRKACDRAVEVLLTSRDPIELQRSSIA